LAAARLRVHNPAPKGKLAPPAVPFFHDTESAEGFA
jgi:hypothetical protein